MTNTAARCLRGKAARNALWIAAGGRCQRCGAELPPDWHADHTAPFAITGRTDVHEMQALCPVCNRQKGMRMLRLHQTQLAKKILEFMDKKKTTISAHVVPGGGKSALPVIAANSLLALGVIDKVCVIVPRLSLKRQAAAAFTDPTFRGLLQHTLEIREACNEPNPSRGSAGYCTTYQALVADGAGINLAEFRRHRYLLVLDEVHHVTTGDAYYKAVLHLWNTAAFRVLMTGTLDRNEGGRIAFLDYAKPDIDENLLPETDITYTLRDGIKERALIPITFMHVDGEGTYYDRRGDLQTFGTLTTEDRDPVWAAINTDDYCRGVLSQAVAHWNKERVTSPRSRMLVVCASIAQARKAKKMLDGLGVSSAIATSAEDDAQSVIATFREHLTPDALVTVQMAYEGLDVPSLTHLVSLTHIRSFPWLVQMFSRITRYDRKGGAYSRQHAYAWVPDDATMQQAIDYFREQQTLGVADRGEDDEAGDGGGEREQREQDQPSAIVPLNGEVTTTRASGLDADDDLSYRQTEAIAELMRKHHIDGSPICVANLLREVGVDTSRLPTQEAPRQDAPQATIRDKETALRKWIQAQLNRIDNKMAWPPGTMNARAFNEAQNYRPRDQLEETDLLRVRAWVVRQMERLEITE